MRSLKSTNLSADAFNKTLELSEAIPEPMIRSGNTGQQNTILTTVN